MAADQGGLAQLLALTQPLAPDTDWHKANEVAFDSIFGGSGRYHSDGRKAVSLRAPDMGTDGVTFASYLHPANPGSGAYGGMSFVLFPVPGQRALISLVVGTNGLSPDEDILARPGHARRVAAICRWLNHKHGHGRQVAWAKQDIVQIDEDIPRDVATIFPAYDAVFKRYGRVLYAIFAPTEDPSATNDALTALLDLAFWERGIATLGGATTQAAALRAEWQQHLLPDLGLPDVERLLSERRYVVIEGPPGTGKTKMALDLLHDSYRGRGMSVQFHPNTTYEDVVGGLAPVKTDVGVGLQFAAAPGVLMRAAEAAMAEPTDPYLLHIDEINRADLAKVLGEAIYLLEPKADRKRTIGLMHEFPAPFGRELSLPDNLHIVGTMNSADRSLAVLDVAVRRRFAFAPLWPQLAVVVEHGGDLMQEMFKALVDIFTEYATDDAFALMPGHSYFLVKDDDAARRALKVTVAPLLREYLAQGYVSGFAEPIRAYLQRIDSL